jgi:uracil-DNA glycosylase family 4
MTKKAKKEEVPLNLLDAAGSKMEKLQALYNLWYGCRRCGLCDFRRNPEGTILNDIVMGEGNPDASVLIVGEAPGVEEEASGQPFVGPSGMVLNQLLAFVAVEPEIQNLARWYSKSPHTARNIATFQDKIFDWRHQNFFITNVVACRPPENRQPLPTEVKACFERLYNIIYIVDPLLIITVGKTAVEALIKKTTEITKFRGTMFEAEIPGRVAPVKYPVVPILHPSYLLRVADWKVEGGWYDKTLDDLSKALGYVDWLKARNYGTAMPERKKIL